MTLIVDLLALDAAHIDVGTHPRRIRRSRQPQRRARGRRRLSAPRRAGAGLRRQLGQAAQRADRTARPSCATVCRGIVTGFEEADRALARALTQQRGSYPPHSSSGAECDPPVRLVDRRPHPTIPFPADPEPSSRATGLLLHRHGRRDPPRRREPPRPPSADGFGQAEAIDAIRDQAEDVARRIVPRRGRATAASARRWSPTRRSSSTRRRARSRP